MPCLQARIFNETPINPRRCLHILTKIIYLLNQVKRHVTSVGAEYKDYPDSSLILVLVLLFI